MPTLTVSPSSGRAYPVVVELGALSALRRVLPLGRGRIVVVADNHVAELYGLSVGAQLRSLSRPVDVLTFPAGEQHKTRETKARLEDEMAERGAGRDAVVVGLGGGVTTDLAGFLAATWMRGVRHVLVPTSLLAMVDAAIGGKTGVDLRAGKNLVGAFHQPAGVVVDPATLATLSAEGIDCGLAEMVKHALVADGEHLDALVAAAEGLGPANPGAFVPLVARSIEIKAEVVSRDSEERGERAILNYGHTVGHAIERAAGYRLSHGHAVSVGLAAEGRISERLGLLRADDLERLEAALDVLGLPTTLPEEVEPEAVVAATASDKKARAGQVRYALLEGIGRPARSDDGWTHPVPDEVVLAVLEELAG